MESLNITANIYAKEPCMINPSSYESLLEWIILEKLVPLRLIKSENGQFLQVLVFLTFLLLKYKII